MLDLLASSDCKPSEAVLPSDAVNRGSDLEWKAWLVGIDCLWGIFGLLGNVGRVY